MIFDGLDLTELEESLAGLDLTDFKFNLDDFNSPPSEPVLPTVEFEGLTDAELAVESPNGPTIAEPMSDTEGLIFEAQDAGADDADINAILSNKDTDLLLSPPPIVGPIPEAEAEEIAAITDDEPFVQNTSVGNINVDETQEEQDAFFSDEEQIGTDINGNPIYKSDETFSNTDGGINVLSGDNPFSIEQELHILKDQQAEDQDILDLSEEAEQQAEYDAFIAAEDQERADAIAEVEASEQQAITDAAIAAEQAEIDQIAQTEQAAADKAQQDAQAAADAQAIADNLATQQAAAEQAEIERVAQADAAEAEAIAQAEAQAQADAAAEAQAAQEAQTLADAQVAEQAAAAQAALEAAQQAQAAADSLAEQAADEAEQAAAQATADEAQAQAEAVQLAAQQAATAAAEAKAELEAQAEVERLEQVEIDRIAQVETDLISDISDLNGTPGLADLLAQHPELAGDPDIIAAIQEAEAEQAIIRQTIIDELIASGIEGIGDIMAKAEEAGIFNDPEVQAAIEDTLNPDTEEAEPTTEDPNSDESTENGCKGGFEKNSEGICVLIGDTGTNAGDTGDTSTGDTGTGGTGNNPNDPNDLPDDLPIPPPQDPNNEPAPEEEEVGILDKIEEIAGSAVGNAITQSFVTKINMDGLNDAAKTALEGTLAALEQSKASNDEIRASLQPFIDAGESTAGPAAEAALGDFTFDGIDLEGAIPSNTSTDGLPDISAPTGIGGGPTPTTGLNTTGLTEVGALEASNDSLNIANTAQNQAVTPGGVQAAAPVEVNQFDPFDPNDATLKFLQEESRRSVESSAAARGNAISGGTLSELSDRAQDVSLANAGRVQAISSERDRISLTANAQQFGQSLDAANFNFSSASQFRNQLQGEDRQGFELEAAKRGILFNENQAVNQAQLQQRADEFMERLSTQEVDFNQDLAFRQQLNAEEQQLWDILSSSRNQLNQERQQQFDQDQQQFSDLFNVDAQEFMRALNMDQNQFSQLLQNSTLGANAASASATNQTSSSVAQSNLLASSANAQAGLQAQSAQALSTGIASIFSAFQPPVPTTTTTTTTGG